MNAPLLADLRTMLDERFRGARPHWDSRTHPRTAADATSASKTLPTGVPAWDQAAQGLRLGEVTELCGHLGGTSLVLEQLLQACFHAGWMGAWVDAGGALDPVSWSEPLLRRILWVRCNDPLTALRSADLLLRDGTPSWVLLDLQNVPARTLQRIPNSHWHRFHRLVEHHGNALLVLSPSPLVEGARTRIALDTPLSLAALETPRHQLTPSVAPRVFVRGHSPGFAAPHPSPALPIQRPA